MIPTMFVIGNPPAMGIGGLRLPLESPEVKHVRGFAYCRIQMATDRRPADFTDLGQVVDFKADIGFGSELGQSCSPDVPTHSASQHLAGGLAGLFCFYSTIVWGSPYGGPGQAP